ncbi:MAG: endonuclease/exonuclease/phosphatase family protein [Candidatus Comchoanobacterales bacterium]
MGITIKHHQLHLGLNHQPSDHHPILINDAEQIILTYNMLSQPYMMNQIRDLDAFRRILHACKTPLTPRELQNMIAYYHGHGNQHHQLLLHALELESTSELQYLIQECFNNWKALQQTNNINHPMHWSNRAKLTPWNTLLQHQPDIITLQEVSSLSIIDQYITPYCNDSFNLIHHTNSTPYGENSLILALKNKAFHALGNPHILPITKDKHHACIFQWALNQQKQLLLIGCIHHPRPEKNTTSKLFTLIQKLITYAEKQSWFQPIHSIQCYGDFNTDAETFYQNNPVTIMPHPKEITHFRGLRSTASPRLDGSQNIDGGFRLDYLENLKHKLDITTYVW